MLAAVLGGLIGAAYVAVMFPAGEPGNVRPWRGFRTGATIMTLTLGFEFFIVGGVFGRWLSRLPIALSFLVREAVLTLLVVIGLVANAALSHYVDGDEPILHYPLRQLAIDTAFAFVATGFVLFVLQMRRLIGPRTFTNILLGRYLRPVREERVFVLFDLVDSTRLAAELGDERFHAYLSAVLEDADRAVEEHGGEVHAFVGDALIATWPLGGATANAAAAEAVFAARDRLEARAGEYARRFGARPRLRAAMHCGTVVAGECGDSKRQITYLGDALNVTARIEGLAKALGTDVLVSADLLERMQLPRGLSARDGSWHDLKGLARPVQIFRLTREPDRGYEWRDDTKRAGVLRHAGHPSGAGRTPG